MRIWKINTFYNFRFEELVADKVTEKCVWVNGSRYSKQSDACRFFTNFDEAKNYAIGYLQEKIRTLTTKLQSAEASLTEVVERQQ